MKFVFKPAPNYRSNNTTQRIMLELTIALIAVVIFSMFNAYNFGVANLTHLVKLLVSSLLTSTIVEVVYALITKQDILKFLKSSFPWVTSLILVMICPMNISVYAMVVCTFIAIVFGKLIFGGFGQNIFNPAAVGRAVVFASFTASIASDVVTGATPTSSMASLGWVCTQETFAAFIEQFGGLSNMFVGMYAGALGETSALVIILAGVYLSIRKVIDFRVPLVYLGTIFVGSSIVALVHGMGIYYPLFHVLTGGAMFGAVFMLTDPVTNPTTRVGRIVFAMSAGFLTLIIRLFANYPEGVLFSILIMNMLTPMIDKIFDGHQVYMAKKHIISLVSVAFAGLLIVGFGSTSLEAKALPSDDSYNKGANVSLKDANDEFSASIISVNGNVYTVEAKGFQGNNVFEITVENGKIVSVVFKEFNDTVGIGDLADNPSFLKSFEGLGSDGAIDVVSSATYTSKSVASACYAALNEASGNGGSSSSNTTPETSNDTTLLSAFNEFESKVVSVEGNVYTVEAKGFQGNNVFEITVEDGKIVSVVFKEFNDTVGIGDLANTEEYLSTYQGLDKDGEYDVVSGATYTSKSVASACYSALNNTETSESEEEVKGNTLESSVSSSEAKLVSVEGNVYTVEAKGFQANNVFEITVEDGKIVSVVFKEFNDTVGIGDLANTEEYLSTFEGLTIDGTYDVVSSATYTSNSVASACYLALQEASK